MMKNGGRELETTPAIDIGNNLSSIERVLRSAFKRPRSNRKRTFLS